MKFDYMINQERYGIEIEATVDGYRANIGEKSYEIKLLVDTDQYFELELDGKKLKASWAIDGLLKRWVAVNGREWLVEKATTSQRSNRIDSKSGEKIVYAPMPGQVRQVLVAEGDEVVAGQVLLLLEAMKMEIRILSPGNGKVCRMIVRVDQQVDKDEVLLEIE